MFVIRMYKPKFHANCNVLRDLSLLSSALKRKCLQDMPVLEYDVIQQTFGSVVSTRREKSMTEVNAAVLRKQPCISYRWLKVPIWLSLISLIIGISWLDMKPWM